MSEVRSVLNIRLVETEKGIDFFACSSIPPSFISFWLPFEKGRMQVLEDVKDLITSVGEAYVNGDSLDHCPDFLESPLKDFRFYSILDEDK
jgi:hypothetical protein